MADYIRGKKAYTKWDVDADNVDLDLQQDGQLPRIQTASMDWFSGTKGKVLKVLFLISLFLVGLIFGYLIRRGVHEIVLQKQKTKCPSPHDIYMFREKQAHSLQQTIDADRINQWLKKLSSESHRAGTEAGKHLAEHIKEEWTQYGLDSVHLEKYNVMLSLPSNDLANQVNVLDKAGQILISASEAGDSFMHPKMRPYLAYSPNKTAKGSLVYANYGRQEDFQKLKELNVSVEGCIVIMRHGKINYANKVKLAEEHGAVGGILYPDPHDVDPENVETYPNGLGLPGDGVVRGNLKLSPGDPQTPYFPSDDNAFHIPVEEMELPSIPVQPISYNDAQKILSLLKGPIAPEGWKGKLNVSYALGPEFTDEASAVEVIVHNQLHKRHIYNVIATIPGKFEPGRYVIIGCHHDSWTVGSSDPNSGLAILMELARAFGQLRKEGWQPGRTIILASWDAEEYGIIGSFEWAQAHSIEIGYRTVAYINIDTAVTGNHTLEAMGSPLLRQALTEATSMVTCHEKGHSEMSVYDMWKTRRPHKPNSSKTEAEIVTPGLGNDIASFFNAHGVSSVHLQFVGNRFEAYSPLYHSAYDVYDAFANYTDPSFEASKTLGRVVGVLALKLSDSLNLPLRSEHYSKQVKHDYSEFVKKHGSFLKDIEIDLGPLEKAIDLFSDACSMYHDNFDTVGKHDIFLSLREYNDRLLELERAFLFPSGFDVPNYNRHVVYGPSPYDNDKGVVFPHLTKAIVSAQQNKTTDHLHDVKEHLSFVIHVLRSAVNVLKSDIYTVHKEL